MNPERWNRVEDLFHRAVDLSGAEREALIDAECCGDDDLRARVQRMLENDAQVDELLDAPGCGASAARIDPMLGREIGAYRLISRLAMGGMGVVYRARRIDGLFEHEVAVKLIRTERATEGMIRRFELERATLAALSHPNIARLHDGGTTPDGLPYLVMELIHGVPIDRYCDARQLSVEQRLRMFVTVCQAVHHAHQSLVVHRDLKPSNVLIDRQGVPKLLDFGIARLLEKGDGGPSPAATRTVARILTPEYASPEQLTGGPVTTAIDVYSLGVVLYELLTGKKPFPSDSRSPADWQRVVTERTPTRPSTAVVRREPQSGELGAPRLEPAEIAARFGNTPAGLRRKLSGDLDRIVLMALRKEPERRYASAQAFADDIERHLDGQPVLAREDSLLYRSTRFVQRNRIAVAAAVAVLLALLVGLLASLRSEQHARAEALHAQIEAESFQGIAEFLMDTFLTSTETRDATDLHLARDRVLLHAERVRRQYADQDHLRANLIDALGRVCLRLDMADDAESLLREAMDIRARAFGRSSLEFALSLRSVGQLSYQRGAFDEAVIALRQALELHRSGDVGVHRDVAGVANDLAACLRHLGRSDEAEQLHREALDLRRQEVDQTLPVAESLNNLAGIHLDRGEHAAAAELLAEAVEIRSSILSPRHPLTLQAMSNLATATWQLGKRDEALRLLREAEHGYRELHADGEEGLGRVLSNLAVFHIVQADFDAADACLAEALDLQSSRLGGDHPIVVAILTKLAILQHTRGRDQEARETWEHLVEVCSSSAAGERSLGHVLYNYGVFLMDTRAYEDALTVLEETLSLVRAGDGSDPVELGRAELALAECLAVQDRRDDAVVHFGRAVSELERAPAAAGDALERARSGQRMLEKTGDR